METIDKVEAGATLRDLAITAWREEEMSQRAQRAAEALARLERRRERFASSLDRILQQAIAPQDAEGDLSGPLTVVIEDLTFADGTEYEFGDGLLYVVRRCGLCHVQMAFDPVQSLWTLGKILAYPAECGECFSRIARATEALVEAGRAVPPTSSVPSRADQALGDWGLALADLEQAVAEATDAARLLRTLRRTEAVALAEHARAVRAALAGQPTSEPERIGAFLDRVHGDGQYRAILTDVEGQTRRWEQAAAEAELARQRCRLAAAVLALHAGRHDSEVGA